MKYIDININNQYYHVEDRNHSVEELISLTGRSVHKNDLVIHFEGGTMVPISKKEVNLKKVGKHDIERFTLMPTDHTSG